MAAARQLNEGRFAVLVGFSAMHLVVLAILVALVVIALVQVWRDVQHALITKILWTIVIVLLPLLGLLGWFINWGTGKITRRLNARNSI